MAILTIHGAAAFEARPAPRIPRTGYLLDGVRLDIDDYAAMAAVARSMIEEVNVGNLTYAEIVRHALRSCSG